MQRTKRLKARRAGEPVLGWDLVQVRRGVKAVRHLASPVRICVNDVFLLCWTKAERFAAPKEV